MGSIGQSVQRIDAVGKVTGETLYPGDIDLPGQLWMKILFATLTHCFGKSFLTTGSAACRVVGLVVVLGGGSSTEIPR